MAKPEPIVLEFFGRVPSKKNCYTPRKDKPGMYKSPKLRAELDRLEMQVPGSVRDLKLISPDVQVEMWVTSGRSDRDGALTTLLDILKNQGVIEDDRTDVFNGTITVLPAIPCKQYRTEVRLYPRSTA